MTWIIAGCCQNPRHSGGVSVREGKDKGQGVGYLPDGTMVVVNGHTSIGQHVEVQVQSLLQTGAGVIVFAELKQALPTPATPSDTAMIGR